MKNKKTLSFLLVFVLLFTYIPGTLAAEPVVNNFEELPVGDVTTGGYGESIAAPTTLKIVEENGQKIMRLAPVEGSSGSPVMYIIPNGDTFANSNYVTTSACFRMSDLYKDPEQSASYGSVMYQAVTKDSTGTMKWITLFYIGEDGKTIFSAYTNLYDSQGSKVEWGQAIAEAEAPLTDQWLTVDSVFNSMTGDITVSFKAEAGEITHFTLKAETELKGGILWGSSLPQKKVETCRATVDVKQVCYQAKKLSAFDIDFENTDLGDFTPSTSWGTVTEPVTMKVEQEKDNRYLQIDATGAVTKNPALYFVNWATGLLKDSFSETNVCLRVSELSSSGGSGLNYANVALYFDDGNGSGQWPRLFAIGEDGKSIVATNSLTYQNGQQKKSGDVLYTDEEGLSGKWLQVRIVQDFETGSVTVRIYHNGNYLTEFTGQFGTVMTSRFLKGIMVELPNAFRADGSFRRLRLDMDDIVYSTTPLQEPAGSEEASEEVTKIVIIGKGKVEADGVELKTQDQISWEGKESVVLSFYPDQNYILNEVTADGKQQAVEQNQLVLKKTELPSALLVIFKERELTNEERYSRDFEQDVLGNFSEYGYGEGIKDPVTLQVVKEQENQFLRFSATGEVVTNPALYVIPSNAVLSGDDLAVVTQKVRFSDITYQEGTDQQIFARMQIYISSSKWPSLFGIAKDGTSLISLSDNTYLESGEQIKNQQVITAFPDTLEDQWLTVKTVVNFKTGIVRVIISNEGKETITDFSLLLGSELTGTYLKGMLWAMPNAVAKDGAFRRGVLDVDDIQYSTSDQGGSALDPIPADQCKRELYVAPNGSDENDGSIEAPFATLEKARNTIRRYEALPKGGITVFLREGVYPIKKTFSLTSADSGTEESPICYQAYPGERVVIDGKKSLDFSHFSPVSGAMKDKLLSADAQNHVITADLADFDIDGIEKYSITNKHSVIEAPFILYDETPLKLSRWPNSEDISQWPVVNGIRSGYVERSGTGEGTFLVKYFTDRPNLWFHNQLDEVMAMGYWATVWYAEAQYVTIDREEKTLEAQEASMYGAIPPGYVSKDREFYFLNVYEELDQPGEFYIDRKTNQIYLYPATSAKNPDISMTWADFNFISMTGASHISIQGLTLTGGKQNGISVTGGEDILIDQCDIHLFNKKGVLIHDAMESGIQNSKLYYFGEGAVELTSGNKTNLTPGNSFFTNNLVHDFSLLKSSYGPAVDVGGVGNLINHNEFYNAPHQVIALQGVDHIMEYNIFHDVVQNAADMGAIYMGRRLTDHDNIVRYNYFYNIGSQNSSKFVAHAIFPDDADSDLYIYGNVFGKGMENSDAIKTHGGQNVQVTNNIFIDCNQAFMVCDWPVETWKSYLKDASYWSGTLGLAQTEPYISRWPWLKDLADGGTNFKPGTHVFEDNVVVYLTQTKKNYLTTWGKGMTVADLIGVENNLVLQQDTDPQALFVDYAGGDLTLRMDAVVYQQLPDFQEIPFREIGRRIENQSMALAEIDQIETELKKAEQGAFLGQYPASAIQALQKAVDTGKEICRNTEDPSLLTDEVAQLNKAYQEFLSSVISAVTVDGQGTVEVPIGFKNASVSAGDLKGDVMLQVNGGISGGITVTGQAEGHSITVQIPDQTPVQSGEMLGLGLSIPQDQAAVLGNIFCGVRAGNEIEYEKPLRIVLAGAAGKEAVLVQNNQVIHPMILSQDSPDGLSSNQAGVYSSNGDLVIYSYLGGVFLAYTPLAESDALALQNIFLDGTPLKQFYAKTLRYTIMLEPGAALPKITAEAKYSKADLRVTDAVSIPGTATILVTAPGTEKKALYQIYFTDKENESSNTGSYTPPVTSGNKNTGLISIGGSYSEKKRGFEDIEGHWAQADIEEMWEKGVVAGITSTAFGPDLKITRAEFAAIIVRALNLTAADGIVTFADVDAGAWYAEEVAAAAAVGLLNGYEGYFRPEDHITREEMSVVIVKAYQFIGKATVTGQISRYHDSKDISTWALSYADQAVSSGLMSGITDTFFAPQENATRAQVTSLIKRLLNS